MRENGRQQFLNLIHLVLAGFAAGQDVKALRWQLQDGLEAWDRTDAEAWLETQARALTPRKPRITAGVYQRAAAGDLEAQRLLDDREAERRRPRRRSAASGGAR